MFGRNHLRKDSGLGRIFFMAAAAEVGDIGKLRLVRRRIVGSGVQVLGTMACLAGDARVLSGGTGFALIVMAQEAGILARVGNRLLPDHL